MTHRAELPVSCRNLDGGDSLGQVSHRGPYRSMSHTQPIKDVAESTAGIVSTQYKASAFVRDGIFDANQLQFGVIGVLIGGVIVNKVSDSWPLTAAAVFVLIFSVVVIGAAKGLIFSVRECNKLSMLLSEEKKANRYVISAVLRPFGRFAKISMVCVFVVEWSDGHALLPGTRVFVSSSETECYKHIGGGVVQERQPDGKYIVSLDYEHDDAKSMVANLLSETPTTKAAAMAKVRIFPASDVQHVATSTHPVTDTSVAPVAVTHTPGGAP